MGPKLIVVILYYGRHKMVSVKDGNPCGQGFLHSTKLLFLAYYEFQWKEYPHCTYFFYCNYYHCVGSALSSI
jgi:hypothetical protein